MCLLLTLIVLPFILFFKLSFSISFNIVDLAIISFSWINFSIRLTLKVIKFIIGNSRVVTRFFCNVMQRYLFFYQVFFFLPHLRLYLLTCGDIESNPGQGNNSAQYLSICHWNLNGLASHDFIKISLIEAFNSVQNFDIICISETFLDSTYLPDDPKLSLQGYAMIRSDHPSNTKRGGVCIFYKEHLPFVNRTDLSFVDECLVGEINYKNSKCFVSCFYRSPNQTEDEFNNFIFGFDKTCSSIALENHVSSIILGDFNAKCTNWWSNGVNDKHGLELFNSSSLQGYSQVISEPTNFQPNSSPSCIDLIFTNEPNLFIESGVHASLSNTCHHQIIYAKISFKIYNPPSYYREVWHYSDAQTNSIQSSINNFDWKNAFRNLSINDQVDIFTNNLFNIFRNFIPHENVQTKRSSVD